MARGNSSKGSAQEVNFFFSLAFRCLRLRRRGLLDVSLLLLFLLYFYYCFNDGWMVEWKTGSPFLLIRITKGSDYIFRVKEFFFVQKLLKEVCYYFSDRLFFFKILYIKRPLGWIIIRWVELLHDVENDDYFERRSHQLQSLIKRLLNLNHSIGVFF